MFIVECYEHYDGGSRISLFWRKENALKFIHGDLIKVKRERWSHREPNLRDVCTIIDVWTSIKLNADVVLHDIEACG